jgi:general secretion pathway protein L
MPTVTPDARLFGIDLRSLGQELRQAWADVLRAPVLSWLTPEAPVVLLQDDGSQTVWQAGVRLADKEPKGKPQFFALQVPEDLLLRRTLHLPPMDATDRQGAIGLQVRALSPFADADLIWGSHVHPLEQGVRVDVALASRRQVEQYLQTQMQRMGSAAAEVWAVQPGRTPIVFAGFGETARHAYAVRGRRLRIALLVLALALLGCIALTPTLQLRVRAIDAVRSYDALAQRTPELVQSREQFLQTADKLQALSELVAGRIEPLRILERLTAVLPDDTALQGFVLKGDKVTLSGLTGNASAVMQTLGQQPGMRDVRAPSPAVRVGGASTKENFVVEFTLDPQAFGVASTAPASPPAAVSPPPAAQETPAVPATPAPDATAAATAKPPAAGAAQAGQVPVFGGSPPAKPAAAGQQHKDKP